MYRGPSLSGVTRAGLGPSRGGVSVSGVCINGSVLMLVAVDAGVGWFDPGVCFKGSGVKAGALCSSSAIVVANIRISKSEEFDSACALMSRPSAGD